MSRKLLSLFAVLAMTVTPRMEAQASYVEASQLSALCKANIAERGHDLEAAECLGYIVGVADSFDCGEQLHGLNWNSTLPVSELQLVTTVLQWLETHPSAGRDGSAPLVAAALAQAFPCEQ